jgi:acetyl esterase
VAGESVGGNMTAALALMAKERGDVTFVQQSMYYPVTDAAMNTAPYEQFATGSYLTRKAMQWFWDADTTDPAQRAEITASPNQASTEQVTGLPPTYLCVDEADVLRDEGEASAARLRSAGVPVTTVRYNGTIHDFMLVDALSETAPREPPSTRPPRSYAPGSEPPSMAASPIGQTFRRDAS